MMKRRFPSQDIWEDTPNSLQLQATVETPELVEERTEPVQKTASAIFESPETEAARKGEVYNDEKAEMTPSKELLAKSEFMPHIRKEMHRPGLKQRFPSKDIWEDSPDHAHLQTTVAASPDDDIKNSQGKELDTGAVTSAQPDRPEMIDEKPSGETKSEVSEIEKPEVPLRQIKTNILEDNKTFGSQDLPSIPARPPRRLHQVPPADIPNRLSKLSTESSPMETSENAASEIRKPPVLPDRPKPKIPVRPAKSATRDSSEMAPLSKSVSAKSTASRESTDETEIVTQPPPAPKPKPVLPSRSVGGKIASLKAGFLSDLDKRLQHGPSGLKPQEKAQAEPEIEEEKAPLADARKSRAKGPARRKPIITATPAVYQIAEELDHKQKPKRKNWSAQEPWTLWQTEDDGSISAVNASVTITARPQTKDVVILDSKTSLPLQTDTTEEHVAKAPEEIESAAPKSSISDQAVSGDGFPIPVIEDSTAVPLKEPPAGFPNKKPCSPTFDSSLPDMTQAVSDAVSQTGETAITINPRTEKEEKMTVYLDGVAQEDERNRLTRE